MSETVTNCTSLISQASAPPSLQHRAGSGEEGSLVLAMFPSLLHDLEHACSPAPPAPAHFPKSLHGCQAQSNPPGVRETLRWTRAGSRQQPARGWTTGAGLAPAAAAAVIVIVIIVIISAAASSLSHHHHGRHPLYHLPKHSPELRPDACHRNQFKVDHRPTHKMQALRGFAERLGIVG